MVSSGMMCTSARSVVATPWRLSAFFRIVSCCRRFVSEMTRSWRAGEELRLRARDFDFGERADADLFLIVLQQLFGGGHFLLFGFHDPD